MDCVVGFPASLHVTQMHGEKPFDLTVEGILDEYGTFHYMDNSVHNEPGGALLNSIPNANKLFGDAIITLTDSKISITSDGKGSLVVTERQGWTQKNQTTRTIRSEYTKDGKVISLPYPASLAVGKNVPNPDGKTTRLMSVIFEAGDPVAK